MRVLFLVVSLIFGWNWLLAGEPDMCTERTKLAASQEPYALEILAARHPLSVGLVRSLLNKDGQLDQFLQAVILGAKNDDSVGACVVQVVYLHLRADQVRTMMADAIEKGLDIKDYP